MNLNRQQLEAINAPCGPILVIAGAGTGKTTVLIQRIVFLLEKKGINPNKILVITFTNKARDEIKNRVSRYAGITIPHVYTFHGFFYRLLKRYEKRNFRVLDESDQRSIIRKSIKESDIEPNLIPPRIIASIISNLKTSYPGEVESHLDSRDKYFLEIIPPSLIKKIYVKYRDNMKWEGALDYDDLEAFSYEVLKNEEIRNITKARFDAILIDEFQDTSALQLEIVKQIVGSHGNIFCVGDPDQSIYGFRGAKPRVCSEFLEIFENASVIKLEENYRSTKNILTVSNHLINKSPTELSKNLFTNKDRGHPILYKKFYYPEDEAEWVLDEIENIRKTTNDPLKSFVILYRNNLLARPFELALSRRQWAFSVTNMTEFFAREEIKVVIAYLTLIFHDTALESFARIRDKPVKGIGENSLRKFEDFIKSRNWSISEGIENIEESTDLKPGAKKSFKKFGLILKKLRENKDTDIELLVELVLEETGYRASIIKDNKLGKLENIDDLVSIFSSIADDTGAKNEDIISEAALRTKDPREKHDDFLLLSTIHQAKGLEFDYVFLVRAIQGILPSIKSLNKKTLEGLNEERRLTYVAFTRAKKRLYITSSTYESRSGDEFFDKESEFVTDIKNLPCVKQEESKIVVPIVKFWKS